VTLSDRLRDIVKTGSVRGSRLSAPAWEAGLNPRGDASEAGSRSAERIDPADVVQSSMEAILGGRWRSESGGRCFVVERTIQADTKHGVVRIADLAESLNRSATAAAIFASGKRAAPPFVFFDLETTGLSGGAGTYAFLVGVGRFNDAGGFDICQYVLNTHADERPMLRRVCDDLLQAGALVSFNGKAFDASLLETRYLFHRLEWAGGSLPHIDVLHPARRFWRRGEGESCSLSALEQQVLGARRPADVPGIDIPSRYFRFVRSGDPRPLVAILEHNRLDLLSLAGLCAQLLSLVAAGAGGARSAQEALALGRLYARAGRGDDARSAFERALGMTGTGRDGAEIRVESLRALAAAARRAHRYGDAERRWLQLLDTPGCPTRAALEAFEALAVHHEHRMRDLNEARRFALETLQTASQPRFAARARHRLARLERKLANGQAGTFPFFS
jgi:uncharacterized protein YprB with RNaseH-like and TPR domain